MNNCEQTLYDEHKRNITFQSGINPLHKKEHFPPIFNISQNMHLSYKSPYKKQIQKFKLNHIKSNEFQVTAETAQSLRTTERVSVRQSSKAQNFGIKNNSEKKNSFKAILEGVKEKKLVNLKTGNDLELKNLFDLQKKERNSSNFKISEMQNQEHTSGESHIKIAKNNILKSANNSISFHQQTLQNNSYNQQKQPNALQNIPNINTKVSANLNILKAFNFSDKSKTSSRNSSFKITLPKKFNQSKGRFSNVNIDSLSTLGKTARIDQTPANRYSNCSTVYKSGSQIHSPKLSLVKNYKSKEIKPSRYLVVDKASKDNAYDLSIKNLIKNENKVEININNSKSCKMMNKFKREEDQNLPVCFDVTNKSKHFQSTTINFEEQKSSYFTPKSFAEIKQSALERSNKNFFKSAQNTTLSFEKVQKEKIDFQKVMQAFKQTKQTAVREQNNLKANFSLNPKQEDVFEMRKFMSMNFSRYNISQLRSLHSAIIQNSKGDPIQLKKGLIVVMNMSGILIQQERLNKFKVPLKSQKKCPQNNSYSFQKSMKDFQKKEDKTNIKKSFGLDERITKFKSDYFPLCKSSKNIPTMRSINTNRSMKKSQKNIKSSKNIANKIGININALLNDNIKTIANFEKFLEVYKQIETHYFKQTIIDYLNLILASTTLHYSTQKTKKTKIVKVKKQIASNSELSQKELSISSEENNENEAIQKEDAEIGYYEIYEAFKARSTSKGAQRIANTFQAKIKEKCKQDIRFIFHTSQNKSKHEQVAIKTEKAIQNQLNNFNIQQIWKVKVGALYNLCYSDNQLCQIIHDYYVKELSPVLQNNHLSIGTNTPTNSKSINMTKRKKN